MPDQPKGSALRSGFRFESSSPAVEKPLFFERLREFATAAGWHKPISDEIELILEEWLTNVIRYGVAASQKPWVALDISHDDREVLIQVEDNGIPFDPTNRSDPDLSVPPEDRPIGGLGIYMIKRLSRCVAHERRGTLNVFSIRKSLLQPMLGATRST